MEESKALNKLAESTDLLGLLEEILNPASIERLSPSAWSGLRLTLRNARETLQVSHAALSKEFVNRSRQNGVSTPAPVLVQSPVNNDVAESSEEEHQSPISNHISDAASKIQITRRDLKASLERFIER